MKKSFLLITLCVVLEGYNFENFKKNQNTKSACPCSQQDNSNDDQGEE